MILQSLGLALQLSVTVAAPDTITVRQPASVTVRAVVRGPIAPTIRPPAFAPLNGMRVEESVHYDRVNGRSAIVEHRYVIVAPRPGTVTLGAFEARAGGVVRRSSPIRLTVIAAPGADVPAVVSRARLDPKAGVSFHALVSPDTVYVGEQATYQVGVFLNDDVRYRLRRNPEFIPPELRSMLAYDLSAPRSFVSRRVIDGRRYEVHVFQRALFPLTAGRYEIAPARLNYSLPLSASFFSREESHQLRSETVPITVIEPPADGRPPDYRGAVGRLSLAARLDSGVVKVGDPVVFTVRVSGDGNVSFFPRPEVQLGWGQLVPAEERVELDSSAMLVRGAKEFDWIITPVRSGEVDVPPIRYPYFNPYTERYELAVTAARRLDVAPGSLAAPDPRADSARPPLSIRRVMGRAVPPPASSGRGLWLVVMAAPLPAVLLLVGRRPRTRRVPTARERLRRLAHGSAAADPPTLRRAFAAALAERIGVAAAELSDRRALARALRMNGVTGEVAERAGELLSELDIAVYSGRGAPAPDAARRAGEVLRRVDAEAKPRIIPPAPRRLSAVGIIGLSLVAQQPARDAREMFDRGVREYEVRRFSLAERYFAEAARLEPRSPDAWANFGTAAWAARDTAAAVIGWHRALRLDPLAADARARLDMTPGPAVGSVGMVPPMSESAAALTGAACWVLAWTFAALAVWRRRRPFRYAAYGFGIGAIAVGIAGAMARRAHDAPGVAVVIEATRLRALPVLGGEPGAPVLTGELARTVRAQGVWSLVRLTDDRQGWVETERLEPVMGR